MSDPPGQPSSSAAAHVVDDSAKRAPPPPPPPPSTATANAADAASAAGRDAQPAAATAATAAAPAAAPAAQQDASAAGKANAPDSAGGPAASNASNAAAASDRRPDRGDDRPPAGSTTDMTAEEWKKRGNAAFTAQNYQSAIEYYSNGIEIEPTNAALFSNRSAAYLKVEDYARARRDADMCIDLDKHWAKGYWRRGQAQLEDQDYYGARDTFKKGLEFCERDDNLVRGLENAEKRIQIVEKVQGPNDGSATERFDINGTTPAQDDHADAAPKSTPNPDGPKFPGSAEEEIERIGSAPNHYAVLHVSPDSSPAELKRNYHLLARMLHPDKCQLPGSSEAMSKVSLAYDTLTNLVKRTLYDQYMAQTTGSGDAKGKTYAEWEATQQPVDLPKWLKWLLGIKGCGYILAFVVFIIMLPFVLIILILFLILWLLFLPYRLTLRHCFPERYARMKEEAERERAKMEEMAQDRQFPAV